MFSLHWLVESREGSVSPEQLERVNSPTARGRVEKSLSVLRRADGPGPGARRTDPGHSSPIPDLHWRIEVQGYQRLV